MILPFPEGRTTVFACTCKDTAKWLRNELKNLGYDDVSYRKQNNGLFHITASWIYRNHSHVHPQTLSTR